MTAERFDRVTEPQRECLRLVLTRRNSKEIALLLGVSPFTVDKRLERAVASLGAANRFEAARLLAEHEGTTYDPLAYQSPDIVEPLETDKLAASEGLASVGDGDGEIAPWLPLRPKGGRVNTLTVWQRLAWIGLIPAGLAVAVGMLGFGLSVAGKVIRAIAAVMS